MDGVQCIVYGAFYGAFVALAMVYEDLLLIFILKKSDYGVFTF